MKALIEIQSKLNAPKGQYNSFGKYKYRSCEDILSAVKPLLTETGCTLIISDEVRLVGDRYYIEATAILKDSEGNEVTVRALAREADTKKGMDESQITGSASSYARKYALNGLFAIDDTKDADTKSPEDNTAKPTLESSGKAYQACVKALASGNYTINDISKKYHLTDEVTEKLMNDANV